MFIAMNRFRVHPDAADQFEDVWRNRTSTLDEMPGFRSFNLLKGAEKEDHILYASHTIWESRQAFEDWTRSQNFRDAHKGAGQNKGMYLGHPEFEGFEAVEGA
ncbi:MAG: antibiotic biosynthesis monooxygenase [Pseudomonadota bacterium]